MRELIALVSAATALALFFALPPSAPVQAPQFDGHSRFAGSLVDLHTHVDPPSVPRALELFDRWGIRVAVNLLPVAYSEEVWAVVRRMEAASGGRLVHFVGADWQQVLSGPADDFGAPMAENLDRAVAAGARGLKIPKALGLGIPAPEGGLLAVDDARLDPLWQKAGELRVPVAIHIGDPVAFWEPLSPDNERFDELKLNPGWSNAGREELPSHAELMAAQRRLFAKHPTTTFIAVHVAGFPEDLDWVSTLLNDLDNVYVDIAARVPELGRHPPARTRQFFLEHQDRIVFGTDLGVNPQGLMLGAPLAWREGPRDVERFFSSTYRFLETDERGFEHPTPIQGRWRIDGVSLPDVVLRKLYWENAARLLRLPPTRPN